MFSDCTHDCLSSVGRRERKSIELALGMCVIISPCPLRQLTSLVVWINLPIAAVAWLLLLISLKDVPLRRPNGVSWKELGQKFDIVGLYVKVAIWQGLR